MLIVLMFHQIVSGKDQESLNNFCTFLEDLQKLYIFTVPGERLSKGVNICLTFDDAYFDFYYHIYPLLKQYQIPAVLGIPTAYIQESTSIPARKRLGVLYPQGMAESKQSDCPLCTWKEIDEMVQSGLVIPASHSLTHPSMISLKLPKLREEIIESKRMLSERLNYSVKTFIYPYGKGNTQVYQETAKHYAYIMRIGSAVNLVKNWEQQALIYRINADLWWKKQRKIRLYKLLPETIKYHVNQWRNK